MKKALLTTVLWAILSTSNAQTRYYVDLQASGQNTGNSWSDAFTDLHDAMVLAVAGDEIWVAGGTYHPSASDRTVYYSLLSGVQLLGSFAGTEMVLEERSIGLHPTVIDGDIGVAGDRLDNSHNLLYLISPDSTTLIDGFTFRNGQADKTTGGTGSFGSSGAAILIHGYNTVAHLTIRNCKFEDNYSRHDGGAVCVTGGLNGDVGPIFEHCKFYRNTSDFRGGAVCELNGSRYFGRKGFYHCEFGDNQAKISCGALFFSTRMNNNVFNITNCTFKYNKTVATWRPLSIGIGYIMDSISYLKISNSSFFENYGGYRSSIGFDIASPNVGRVQTSIKNSVFDNYISSLSGNEVTWFLSFESNAEEKVPLNEVDSCKFYISTSAGVGGLFHSDLFTINNSVIIENDNFLSSGIGSSDNKTILKNSAYIQHPASNNQGSFEVRGKSFVIENTSIVKNKFIVNSDTLQIINSIIDSDRITTSQSFPYELKTTYLSSNLFTFPTQSVSPSIIDSNNLWSALPMFMNPDSGDLRLQPCSPAINAGDNTLVSSGQDISGNDRIRFGRVDMGAYEMGQLAFGVSSLSGPDCTAAGQTTGSIDLSTVEACPPVSYSWDNGLPPLAVHTGLESGFYTATITDAKGRSVVQTVEVGISAAPVVSPQTIPVFCHVSQAGVADLLTTGLGPFSFSWPDGGTDSLRTGLLAGLYTVTVADRQGCTVTGMASVGRSGSLSIETSSTPVSCAGESDGALEVWPVNGLPPYTWQWSNGSTASQIEGLSAGPYSGMMVDSLGCSLQWSLIVAAPEVLELSAEITPATNPGVADGAIALQPTGGVGGYTVAWSHGAATLSVTGLLSGVYTATVTDANGCTASVVATVTDPSATAEAVSMGVKVWPNPASWRLWVEAPEVSGSYTFLLWDVNGRLVKSCEGSGMLSVGIGELPSGAYIWQFVTEDGIATDRVVVE